MCSAVGQEMINALERVWCAFGCRKDVGVCSAVKESMVKVWITV